MARRGRRLPALDQGLDGDDQRIEITRSVLHPPLQGGRSQCGRHLQRGQRRADARPARRDRRRLPRAVASRHVRRRRSRFRQLIGRRRRDHQERHRQRAGLAPLQRRRVRRRRRDRQPVGAERQGHRSPVAGADRRACRTVVADRRHGHRRAVARCHGAVLVGRRADRRAELGAARSGGIIVRHRPDHCFDRFRERQAGRFCLAAGVVGGLVRTPRRRSTCRPTRRPTGQHRRALRHQHAGPDDAHRRCSCRQHRRLRFTLDGQRHHRGREPGRRAGDQHRREHGGHISVDRRRSRRFVHRRPTDHRRCQHRQRGGHQCHGRHRPRHAHDRVRLRARNVVARRDRSRRRRQRPRELRLRNLRRLPARCVGHAALPGLRRRHQHHLPRAEPEPVTDLRQPAGRAVGRRLRARSGSRQHLDGGRSPVPQLPDRAGLRLEHADPGTRLRAAVRECDR